MFLSTVLLLQSCVVYHKTPATLEKASREQVKTKVTNTDGDIAKIKYVTYESGVFYGVNKKSGELVKTPLDEEYINKIVTKNKSASTWATVTVIAIPVAAVIILIATAYPMVDYSGGWYNPPEE